MVRDKAVTARHAEGLSNREYVLFLNLSGILRTELWSPGIYPHEQHPLGGSVTKSSKL